MLPLEISVADASALVEHGGASLVDCREPGEAAICAIRGATLIPLGELAERVGDLAEQRADRIIVYCHHGVRSYRAAVWLRQQGFARAQSLAGGIEAWAVQVDPAMPRY